MAASGRSFDEAFLAPLLARNRFDGGNPASFAALTGQQRSALFMDWHDTLMVYAGIDHVDHCMGAVDWTPAITQIQGSAGHTVIGIVDSSLDGSADLKDNLVQPTGYNTFVDGHGAGVASLIVGAHDGEGVMGIAPNAKVWAPFAAASSTWPKAGRASSTSRSAKRASRCRPGGAEPSCTIVSRHTPPIRPMSSLRAMTE